jgi:hypothetical protein
MLLKIDPKNSKPLYRQLIDEIENLIDQGTLRAGQFQAVGPVAGDQYIAVGKKDLPVQLRLLPVRMD